MTATRSWVIPASLTGLIVVAIVAFLVGHATTSTTASASSPNPIQTINGIPVGIQDSPAGALAAADNYVTESSETAPQNLSLYDRFVRTVYVPERQQATLSQVRQQRADDPEIKNYQAGGKGVTFIAARRLDSYTPASATVTSWIEAVGWGPLQQPKQGWLLVATTLRWGNGRWLVETLDPSPSPAPTPALAAPSSPTNQTAAAFDSSLKAMSTPYYGTGG